MSSRFVGLERNGLLQQHDRFAMVAFLEQKDTFVIVGGRQGRLFFQGAIEVRDCRVRLFYRSESHAEVEVSLGELSAQLDGFFE